MRVRLQAFPEIMIWLLLNSNLPKGIRNADNPCTGPKPCQSAIPVHPETLFPTPRTWCRLSHGTVLLIQRILYSVGRFGWSWGCFCSLKGTFCNFGLESGDFAFHSLSRSFRGVVELFLLIERLFCSFGLQSGDFAFHSLGSKVVILPFIPFLGRFGGSWSCFCMAGGRGGVGKLHLILLCWDLVPSVKRKAGKTFQETLSKESKG